MDENRENLSEYRREDTIQVSAERASQNFKTNEKPSPTRGDSFDLRELYHNIIANVIPILLIAIAVAAASGMYAIFLAPSPDYAATSKVYTIIRSDNSSSSWTDVQMSTVLTADYAELFNTWEIHALVRNETSINYSDVELKSMLSTYSPEESHVIYITVTAPDAQEALKLANAYGKAVQTLAVQKMGVQMPSLYSEAISVELVNITNPIIFMLCGFLIGFIFSCVVIGMMVFFEEMPRVPEDLEINKGIYVVSVLPRTKGRVDSLDGRRFRRKRGINIGCFPVLEEGFSEGLDQLCAGFMTGDDAHTAVMVTSRYRREGKTLVALSMMKQLAGMKKRVVLLDADLRYSDMGERYALNTDEEKVFYLGDYLSKECGAEEIVYSTNIANAYIVPAGNARIKPLSLLTDQRMGELIGFLKANFDIVLIDVPAAGMHPDASIIGRYCDETLLVVGYGRGSCKDVQKIASEIRRTECARVIAVINQVRFRKYINRRYYYSSERYLLLRSSKPKRGKGKQQSKK